MKLYFKKKAFTLGDETFLIVDEQGQKRYTLKSSTLLVKTIRVFDALDNEVAVIKQELKSLLPKYAVYTGGRKIMEVKKEFSPLFLKYSLDGLGWSMGMVGICHNYEILKNGARVLTMGTAHVDWGETYELDIMDPRDELAAVAVVLAIDYGIEGESFMKK